MVIKEKVLRKYNGIIGSGRRWYLSENPYLYKNNLNRIRDLGKNEANLFLDVNQSKLFFILGYGRTGTQLTSSLLNLTENAIFYHEPDAWTDVAIMDKIRNDTTVGLEYWNDYRKFRIYQRWKQSGKSEIIYGEVNNTIRYHLDAIQKVLPNSQSWLIYRHPRGVIRSYMNWPQFYGSRSRSAWALEPLKDDDTFGYKWAEMSRFTKNCWSWANTYQYLLNRIPSSNWIKFERITTDYEYFSKKILDPFSINISRSKWESRIKVRSKNSNKSYAYPHWSEWNKEDREDFSSICLPIYDVLEKGEKLP